MQYIADTNDPPMSGPRFAEEAGITYRQLDHWTRNGVVPTFNEVKGSGSRRTYDQRDIKKAELLGEISRAFSGGHNGIDHTIMKRVWENYDVGMLVLSELVYFQWDPK